MSLEQAILEHAAAIRELAQVMRDTRGVADTVEKSVVTEDKSVKQTRGKKIQDLHPLNAGEAAAVLDGQHTRTDEQAAEVVVDMRVNAEKTKELIVQNKGELESAMRDVVAYADVQARIKQCVADGERAKVVAVLEKHGLKSLQQVQDDTDENRAKWVEVLAALNA